MNINPFAAHIAQAAAEADVGAGIARLAGPVGVRGAAPVKVVIHLTFFIRDNYRIEYRVNRRGVRGIWRTIIVDDTLVLI